MIRMMDKKNTLPNELLGSLIVHQLDALIDTVITLETEVARNYTDRVFLKTGDWLYPLLTKLENMRDEVDLVSRMEECNDG
jgi:hypothetical protein